VDVRNGSELLVKVGTIIEPEETIAFFDPFSEPIIAEKDGTIKFEDIILGTTLKEEINEDTGKIEKKITEFTLETLQPRLVIYDKNGNELAKYFLPGSAYLNVEDGEKVKAGRVLAKLLKESVKTRDITGGLPRVGELFEARKPKIAAVLARISGIVSLKGIVKGKRSIVVEDTFQHELKHQIPMGKHLLVRDGDEVQAGDMLCDGNIDPHDVLHILGENALQTYLVNEIQDVYRLQGVHINDKHIGIINRQMMRKVEIVQVGDTNFIYGKQVERYKFHEENLKVVREGGQPAVARPLLLGITRASLNIDSFISAASFQETTRVLTNASIAGSVDNLRGLKENVIIGHLIPAGTGMRKYKGIKLFDENMEDIDQTIVKILEEREEKEEKQEKETESVV
jgi:DNA-directed RNA polymerase subunit beta'